jgi:hypothetical protein
MTKTMFKEPVAINDIHISEPGPEFNPLMHKGARLRASSEITSAFALAIARDIANQEDLNVLLGWKRSVLSTTGVLKLRQTTAARYWYAFAGA